MAQGSIDPQGRRFKLPSLLDVRVLGVLAQLVFVVGFILVTIWFVNNILSNLDDLGESQFICVDGSSKPRCSFDFLSSDAQFELAESPIEYDPADSYWRALGAAALNTLKVIVSGIILATILGTFVGIARLSKNWLVANISKWYVDILRNTPLVLQLIIIYFSVLLALPQIEEAIKIPGIPIFISQRGVNFINATFLPSAGVWLAFLVLGLIQAQVLWWILGRIEEQTGRSQNRFLWPIVSFVAIALLGWVFSSNGDNQSILLGRQLQVEEIDDFETLMLQRYDVNSLGEIDLLVANEVMTQDAVDELALSLCVLRDAPSEVNFTAQLRQRGIPYTVNRLSSQSRATSSFADGNCEIYVGPTAVLAGERDILENPNSFLLLPVQETPVRWSIPRIEGFNFVGGGKMTTEFTAVLIGLVLNTGATIAEIVRAGIQSVSKGQSEAARALGLSEGQRLRLVVLPQALRVIIPPQTSQYLNLAKNSSLALAVAYPDFWNIANTTINQSGRSIQIMLIVLAFYLTISLVVSLALNSYNRRIQLVER